MPSPGKFIVFEGIDGSGLSTQAGLLKAWFDQRGKPAYLTKEPTPGPAGAMARLALSGRLVAGGNTGDPPHPLDETTLALLFAADRADHLANDILPKLNKGINVVCDRYYLSNLAYQSRRVDLAWLRTINAPFRKPDLTLLIEVPAQVSLERIRGRHQNLEIYEEAQTLEEILSNYRYLARTLASGGERIEVLDGTASPREVHRRVIELVETLFR